MMRLFGCLLVCLALLRASAAEPRTDVIVLYNSALKESGDVAKHYAAARNIPESHLLGLKLSDKERVSRSDFKQTLQQPLWDWLVQQKHFVPVPPGSGLTNLALMDANVRYLTICYGVPLQVSRDENLKEDASDKFPAELRRNESAVDNELAALPLFSAKPPAVGLFNNHGFLATNTALLHPTNGVLLVGRLDGPTPDLAKGLVDKALAAERQGLWGRTYFDARGLSSGAYELGDKWMALAADMSRGFGFETTYDKQPTTFPTSMPFDDVALYFGWYDTQLSGPFLAPKVDFVPGAIAYHLYSFSATSLRDPGMLWVPNLIRLGATATVGYTDEPYLQFTLDIPSFTQRLLFRGFTFGEAVYASLQTLSWQTTVVGDPLYRPFANLSAEFFANSIAQTNRIGEWALLVQVNRNLITQTNATARIMQELSYIPRVTNSSILMEKIADYRRSRADLVQAAEAYKSALALKPTLPQRARIVMTAGSMLKSLGKYQDAYQMYENLLRDYPDFMGKKDLYDRLATLADLLGKTREAEEYRKLFKG